MTKAAKCIARVFGSWWICLTLAVLASLVAAGTRAQSFVQVNSAVPVSATTVTLAYTSAQATGDLNVVIVGWNDTTTTVKSVVDGKGNAYVLATGPVMVPGTLTQSVYYAKNIVAAAAGTNAVTVTFSTSATYPDVRILEYSGLDTNSPFDGGTGATGATTTTDSGALSTTNANDLLLGANIVSTSTAAPGTGYKQRIVTNPDGDIAEDEVVTSTGSYHATSTLSAAGSWIMQIVAFKSSGAAPAPSAPGNLTASVISSSQINLGWAASTESGGTIADYFVERCQGAGCTNFAQISTTAATTFSDTGLSPSTSYSYRARAVDTNNVTGPYSNVATASTTASGPPTPTAPQNLTALAGSSAPIVIAVQGYKNATEQVTHTTDPFDSTGGDVIVMCASSHAGVTMTPSDSFGNVWISISGPTSTTVGDDLRTQVWYARNPTVGPGHTVTMTMSVTQSLVISIIVGKGSNIASPIDAVSTIGSDAGTTTVNVQSPNITTATSDDLLVGFVKSSTGEVFTPGTGFTAQPNASSNFLFAETGASSAPGVYDATAGLTENSTWQAAVVGVSPSATANSNQVVLGWTASTETGGTIANYLIERCQGTGCGSFSQIAMTPNVVYTDSSVSPSTTYSYRVRAVDTASNTGPYSNVATVTTPAGTGNLPNAPTNLTGTALSSTQTSLSWTASTEIGGTISGYLVERCQGSGCSSFAQIGTSTTTSFSDSGLLGSTSYSYRVRAQDTQNNDGPYSSTASVTTSSPVITAPTNSSASAISATQITVGWTAATETGGTITSYLVERCSGASCANFVQVGTSTNTSYNDSGLAGSTSYSYRVRATDALNDLGPYSTVVSATTSAPVITAPTNLAATSASSTQINLSWTAATETGGTITTYLVERCQGAACTSFAQIGTSATTSYSDMGLLASTSYSYRVRAQDSSSDLGPYSATATATTPAGTPTAPGSLTATAASSVQINLSWTSSTETGGTIASYLIERCQGTGCTSFTQIASTANTSYSDSGLTGSTSYSYRVRAQDTLGSTSPYSATASATTAAPVLTAPTNLAASATSATQISLSWTAATESGGTIANYLIERCAGSGCTSFAQIATTPSTSFNDTGLTGSTSYSYRVRAQDTQGNTSPYSATASATTSAPVITAPTNPAATAVSSTQINLSWTAATETGGTISTYLIERCQGPGCTSFAQIATSATTSYSDSGLAASTSYSYRVRAQDTQSNLGPYSTTASATTQAATPTAPSGLTAAAASSVQINLAWNASTETGGTIATYLIERCQGASCTSFAQIASTASTSFSDMGLTGSTSYSYRVRAQDTLGTNGPYSATASATTAAPVLTAPTNLTPSVISAAQINLSWTAATETGGTIASYLIERCAGAACTTFAQIGTSTTTTFNDTGLTGSTSYSYRVRAKDTAGNTGPYSATATATTSAPVITAPTNLTATAASGSQINLAWTAATETGGTISSYLVERCQGAACTTFAQVGTSATASFADTGLTASTSYSYRVRAKDAAGNTGPYSNTASATTSSGGPAPIAFVQVNATLPASGAAINVAYTKAQVAGDLNVVIVGWNDTTATVKSIVDTKGNTYVLATGPITVPGNLTQAIYYAKNIVAATAGGNTVTVTFSTSAIYPDVRVLEYSGLDTNSPLDGATGATGTATTTDSGALTTTNANDLLIGANIVATSTAGPGTGFTQRIDTNPDGDIAEDRTVTATGAYHATATLSAAGSWIMQVVAFKAAQ